MSRNDPEIVLVRSINFMERNSAMASTVHNHTMSRLSAHNKSTVQAGSKQAKKYKGYSSIHSKKMISIYCNSNRVQMERSLSPQLRKKLHPKGSPY